MTIPLTNDNPNFSLVMPGPCNAACNFCFWKQTPISMDYFDKLDNVMAGSVLPNVCHQISITGGEPTASPIFVNVLNRINRELFKKVVLTTNGFRLINYIHDLIGIVDHINISRHHFNDKRNQSIFNTKSVPSGENLFDIIKKLNELGIDTTLNCVTTHLKTITEFLTYIEFGKALNVNHICFRKPHGNLDLTEIEQFFFNKYGTMHQSKCPVCRKDEQVINGQHVVWRAGTLEPSNDLKGIYEFIMQQDGKISIDWDGKISY